MCKLHVLAASCSNLHQMDAKDCSTLAKNCCTFDSDDDGSISTYTYIYNLEFLAKNRAEDRSIMCIHTVKSI